MLSVMHHRTRTRRAFTLIELLVVIIILAILAAVVLPRVLNRTDDARESATVTAIASISQALNMYKADVGTYPTPDQGLQALITNPGVPKWNGPYLSSGNLPSDGWGQPFQYMTPGSNNPDFDIISAGPPGKGTPIKNQ